MSLHKVTDVDIERMLITGWFELAKALAEPELLPGSG
jgi:hypothetical protein